MLARRVYKISQIEQIANAETANRTAIGRGLSKLERASAGEDDILMKGFQKIGGGRGDIGLGLESQTWESVPTIATSDFTASGGLGEPHRIRLGQRPIRL